MIAWVAYITTWLAVAAIRWYFTVGWIVVQDRRAKP